MRHQCTRDNGVSAICIDGVLRFKTYMTNFSMCNCHCHGGTVNPPIRPIAEILAELREVRGNQ